MSLVAAIWTHINCIVFSDDWLVNFNSRPASIFGCNLNFITRLNFIILSKKSVALKCVKQEKERFVKPDVRPSAVMVTIKK